MQNEFQLTTTRSTELALAARTVFKPASAPSSIEIALGARIRARRRHVDMTQSDVATALGITFQQVQKYEYGSNRIAASTLVRLAEILNTSVAALLGEADDEPFYEMACKDGGAAADLMAAYDAISDVAVRAALVAIAEKLARSDLDPADIAARLAAF